MSYALYITHPEVILDADEPPARWHLSERGRERATAFGRSAAMRPIRLIIASPETKTMETAELLAVSARQIVVGEETHENVRTSTGAIPDTQFEALMDALYTRPDESAAGWETLAATEARIVAAIDAAIDRHAGREPLALVGHGTVGTVFKCHLAGRRPTRDEDQRRMADPGGGNCFVFELEPRRLIRDWVPMEEFGGLEAH